MILKRIDDISDDALRPYRNLKVHADAKSEVPWFIAETHTVIQNAIDAGCVPISFLVEERYIERRDKDLLGRFPDATVYTSSDDILKALTGYTLTRGILSAMTRPQPRTADDLISRSATLAVLENVQDASNVGAILRSACALGIDAVLLDASCCDPLHRKAIRTSMGGVFRIPWAHSAMPGHRIAEALNQKGVRTMAFALTPQAIPLQRVPCESRSSVALFFGSEGNGLSDETLKVCSDAVIIPMANAFDSLNISAAAAIAFWEIQNRIQR